MTLTNEQQCMVEDNMGLVRAVLSRCVNSPGSTGIYSYDDLFQIGCMGLCEAVVQYRPGRAAFSTYAYAAIRNRIYNALTYATYRREKETLSDFLYEPASDVPKDTPEARELRQVLCEAQGRLKGVARKGVDAMMFMSEGFCNVTRSVSKMTEIERRGGKRWDKPKKAEKSRDCGGGKF